METIVQQNVVDAYKSNMARYSIETNRRRSFPDIRDGLKLVQRRILQAMANDLACKTRLVKTSKVTGHVIGTYHPHGDTSVADAITIMANWYSMNIPLIYSESNMGSMQGDSAASQRYTEVMLSEFAKEAVLSEMIECPEVVDWVNNYDNTAQEPEYLPCKVPLLLINGAYGIGVGKMVNIPPHPLSEVIDATIKLIHNPDADVVLIPDQLMPCEIVETNWKQISNIGKGTFIVRSKIETEIFDKGKAKEHYALIIKSTPDRVLMDKGSPENGGVIYKINELIDKGKLTQIDRIFEDSHGTDMRLVIHLKKGADPEYVKQYLYKSTQLQVSMSVNFEALSGIELYPMSYKAYLQAFIEKRISTKYRYYALKLKNARTKYHEREAYVKAMKSGKIMDIIDRIRKNNITNEAENIEWLSKLLKITDIQARYILNTPIKNLALVKLPQYEQDMAAYEADIKTYYNKVLDKPSMLKEIEDELLYFKKKYGRPRKSKIISVSSASNIPEGQFKIVVTENNYIKKFFPQSADLSAYKGDRVKHVIDVENTKDIILITASGMMFKLPVHKVPVCDKFSVGMDLRLLIKGAVSPIIKVLYLPTIEQLAKSINPYYAIMCTEKNCIKKLDLADILIATPSGIIMTKLNDGDVVKSFNIAPSNYEVVVYSKKKALRFNISDIPKYKRNTLGVSAMNTKDDIDGMVVLYPQATDIIVVTESGKINKFNIAGLPKTTRYKAGNSVIKLSRGDMIKSIFGIKSGDTIVVYTRQNKVYTIATDSIPLMSTVSPGDNKIISLANDSIINIIVSS